MNKRAIGKFTDRNHLYSIAETSPANYSKPIIQIYTQTGIFSNDFYNMVSQAETFYVPKGESWKWKIEVPFSYTKIVDVPSSTLSLAKPGIDGTTFEIVLDSNEFGINQTICIGNRTFGPQLAILQDPQPQGTAWRYTCTLVSDHPQTDFLDKKWLAVGNDVISGTSFGGEFTDKGPGLGRGVDYIEMYETMSSSMYREHTITKMADEINVVDNASGATVPIALGRDRDGNILDGIAYATQVRNSTGKITVATRWESFVEMYLRKQMLSDEVWRMLHQKAGVVQVPGKQEWVKFSDGVIPRIRKHGNYVPYNRGELASTLLRTVFGDLFYGRVSIPQRHVKLYTNELGIQTFQQLAKQDALGSGISFQADIPAIHTSGITVNDPSQHLVYGWAFNSMFSTETGLIEVIHLQELDQPQLNAEFGQNKRATPLYIAFDISPDSDGTLKANVKRVRLSGSPDMTWGYVDGRQSHLGHAASKGMQSANTFPGYKIWMEDRVDVFIEDLSGCMLIEELPQY